MNIELRHRGCGGVVEEDATRGVYEYEGMSIPAQVCRRCDDEILGDAQIDLVDGDGTVVNEELCPPIRREML